MLLPKLDDADENAPDDGCCCPKSGALVWNGDPGPVEGFNLIPANGDGIGVPVADELMDVSFAIVLLLALITDRRSITSRDATNE